MTFNLRTFLIAIALMIAAAIGYGEIRYLNGWYAHSDKVNAEYAAKKQKAEIKLAPTEAKAATASAKGKVIYQTIYRDMVKYVQNPNRIRCDFDDDAVRLRQQSIDAANNIAGFDDTTLQAKPSGN